MASFPNTYPIIINEAYMLMLFPEFQVNFILITFDEP